MTMMQVCRFFVASQDTMSFLSEDGEKKMAHPAENSEIPATAPTDWGEVYYTPHPKHPANRPEAPTLGVLEQMYAYYDA